MLRAVSAATLLILAGCSSQETAKHDVVENPTTTKVQTGDSELFTPPPISPSIAFEGGSLSFPFKYIVTFDRTLKTDKFALQRRMFVEIIGGEIAQRSVELQNAMGVAGFSTDYIRENNGVIQGKFSKEDVHSVYTLIRPPGVGPSIREEGAVASLLMTQVLEEH